MKDFLANLMLRSLRAHRWLSLKNMMTTNLEQIWAVFHDGQLNLSFKRLNAFQKAFGLLNSISQVSALLTEIGAKRSFPVHSATIHRIRPLHAQSVDSFDNLGFNTERPSCHLNDKKAK